MRLFLFLILAVGLPLPGTAQEPGPLPALVTQVAAAAPTTLPSLPLREARRTLGVARQQFQRGLPAGTRLYLTAQVLNEAATPELVVVAVETWTGHLVRGRIVRLAAGTPAAEAAVEFEETSVQDWLVLHPSGREEGNFLGKFWDVEDRLAARP